MKTQIQKDKNKTSEQSFTNQLTIAINTDKLITSIENEFDQTIIEANIQEAFKQSNQIKQSKNL